MCIAGFTLFIPTAAAAEALGSGGSGKLPGF